MVSSTAASCAAVLLWMPRPVEPLELPALRLDPSEVRRLESAEAALSAPEGEAAAEMQRLFREQGEGETLGDSEGRLTERGRRLASAVEALREEHGDDAVRAARAAALGPLDELIAGSMQAEENALLGSFPRILARYGAVREGTMRAPRFVVRTLYKARWNAIFKLDPTDGFSDVERQAYWGWLALHAGEPGEHCADCGADIALRYEALQRFAEAGGAGARVAAGVLAFRSGKPDEASQIFHALYEETGALRYRNYALASLAAMH